ncbi:hypothetical protein LMH87_003929 [Akanthomyces muscarius]|uniref:Uncharacterized protein n=1 Tax=Akanthomyces muscarius TaxID=2231603 RepID=A0A9W8Q327_AKAMU|nr:hypothetical protein LMH87_003929 [Akanthomyces muscarius]KAJ4145068.1 hypothetical protein LMH87_003929 [Akanthomyces muscarius]
MDQTRWFWAVIGTAFPSGHPISDVFEIQPANSVAAFIEAQKLKKDPEAFAIKAVDILDCPADLASSR